MGTKSFIIRTGPTVYTFEFLHYCSQIGMNSSLILMGFVLKKPKPQENQSSRYEWHHCSIFTDQESWPFLDGEGVWHVLSDPGQLITLPTLFLHRMDFFFFLRCCHSNKKKTYKIAQTQKGINSNKIIHNRQKPFIYTTTGQRGNP